MSFTNIEAKERINKLEKMYVHSGPFHSDDLLSAAFLKILNPNIKIERIDEVKEKHLLEASNGKSIICDIGGIYDSTKNLYDHHQRDETTISDKPSWDKTKSNNYYSAFGLLWKDYGDYFCETQGYSKKAQEKFKDYFVSEIDAVDNGRRKMARTQFPNLVKSIFNPSKWKVVFERNERNTYDTAFKNSVNYGIDYIRKSFKDINLFLNSGVAEKDQTYNNFFKQRDYEAKSKIYNIYKTNKYLPKSPTEDSIIFACEILNLNKSETKIISDIHSFNNSVTKAIDDKEISKVVNLINAQSTVETSHKKQTGIIKCQKQIDTVSLREIYNRKHKISNEPFGAKVLHCFYAKSEIGEKEREHKLGELAYINKTNFFIYDGSSSIYFDSYNNRCDLDDVMKNGGYLFLKDDTDVPFKKDNIEKIKDAIKTGIYKNSKGEEIKVSNQTYIFLETPKSVPFKERREKAIEKYNEYSNENSNEHIKVDMPFAISFRKRNGFALKFNIDIGDSLHNFKDVSSISNTLFIVPGDKVDFYGTVALLSSKKYYDNVVINGMDFKLEKYINRMLEKTTIYEAIKEPSTLKVILNNCKAKQFLILKNKIEKDGNASEIAKNLISDKENELVQKMKAESKMEHLKSTDIKEVANLCSNASYLAFETNLSINDYKSKMNINKIGHFSTALTFEKDDEKIKSSFFLNEIDYFENDDDSCE